MIIHEIDEAAEKAAARYVWLTESWNILFDKSLTDYTHGSLVQEAMSVAHAFMSTEREHIEDICSEIFRGARTAVFRAVDVEDSEEAPEAASEHLSATIDYIQNELIAQIQRDISMFRQRSLIALSEIAFLQKSLQTNHTRALLEYRTRNPDSLQFSFYDRRAFRWSSKKFVRAMWRHALLSLYNESVLYAVDEFHMDYVRVATFEGDNIKHVDRITLGNDPDLMIYSQVRDKYFHPNSHNFLMVDESYV